MTGPAVETSLRFGLTILTQNLTENNTVLDIILSFLSSSSSQPGVCLSGNHTKCLLSLLPLPLLLLPLSVWCRYSWRSSPPGGRGDRPRGTDPCVTISHMWINNPSSTLVQFLDLIEKLNMAITDNSRLQFLILDVQICKRKKPCTGLG